jgi:hypothetical protein
MTQIKEIPYEQGKLILLDSICISQPRFYPELGFFIHGQEEKDLVEDFCENIRFIWRGYVLQDPQDLTEDAQEFRNKIKSMIYYKKGE